MICIIVNFDNEGSQSAKYVTSFEVKGACSNSIKTRLPVVEKYVSLKIKVKSTHAICITILITRTITKSIIISR